MNYNAVTDFIRLSPHTAIYWEDQEITYEDVYHNVNRYRNKLADLYQIGEHIGIKMSDSPEWIYLFWGCVKAGIIPYLYSTMLKDEEYEDLFKRYPVVDVFDDDNIISFDKSAIDETDHPPVDTSEDSLCFFMFSSGTTGYIKAIPHQHKDMAFTAINYAKKTILLNAYDVTFSAAKLFFAYGFGNSMTFPFFVGAATVLMKEPSSVKGVNDYLLKYKPTVYFGVPSILAGQVRSLQSNPKDLSFLRISCSAGEALPGKILNEWIELTDSPILDGIGSTEALHIFISNRHESFEPNCSGRLVPGYQAKVLDIKKQEVPDGEIGDLYIKGGSLSTGDDWMETGDMYIKKGSRFYYQGRNNDMLKVGGVWVSPNSIEEAILNHPDVSEAGVVYGYSNYDLTKLKAYVVLNNKSKQTTQTKVAIKRLCMKTLPLNNYPSYIEFVDVLPRTATGKLRRHVLRQWEAFTHDQDIDL
jgi:acyl-coenzyme A synthetase/AMP-(fatty) acid ligase